MAFTVLNSGGRIAQAGTLDQVLLELKTALNERRAVLGLSAVTFPTISGSRIAATGMTFITTLRNNIASLLNTNTAGFPSGFVKSDYSNYADVAAVLTAAGHSGGWITDYAVSNKAIWSQFQDVFAELVTYGIYSSDETISLNSYDYTDLYATPDLAWAALVAGSTTNFSPGTGSVAGWNIVTSGTSRAQQVTYSETTFPDPSKPGTVVKTDVLLEAGNTNLVGSMGITADGNARTITSSTADEWIGMTPTGAISFEITTGTLPATNPFESFGSGSSGAVSARTLNARWYYQLSVGDGLTYG